MHYILFYDVVDDYVAKRAQYHDPHLQHVRRAYERGDLILAGALAEPVDGAMLVFRGSSPEMAEEFAKTDPYVINGLVTAWRVRKWMTVTAEDIVPSRS
jgi:hypothetical protein